MRRVVVVCLLAGCFSTPPLRHDDGGAGGDDDANDASHLDAGSGCATWSAWTDLLTIGDGFGPWVSPDGLVLVYQSGAGVWQVERATKAVGWDIQTRQKIYMGNGTNDLQPFLSDDLLHLWIDDNSGGIDESSRTATTEMFVSTSQLAGPINGSSVIMEDVEVSSDGLRMILASGANAAAEDLVISTRASVSAVFELPAETLTINNGARNDCCATTNSSSFLWTQATATGGYAVMEAAWDGTRNFGSPVQVPALVTGDIWSAPGMSRDGTVLVVVKGAPVPGPQTLWRLERECIVPL
jgi:hypothetical protein